MSIPTISIAALAVEFNLEPSGVAAALDLGTVADNHEVDAKEAREILTIMVDQEADRIN